jgi:phosphoglycolate phosphatase
MHRLILFDVDGTLLMTGGRAGRVLIAAISSVFGKVGDFRRFRYSGKTDPQIVHELMASTGVPRDDVERGLSEVFRLYLDSLRQILPPGSLEPLSGVREVLATLAGRDDVALGLLTGNIEGGAQVKLASAGLEGFFPFGAFGSDSADRNVLVPVARQRALAMFSCEFQGHNTVVVGDAEADIHCARAGGARAVAVATGWTPKEDLAALQPDALLDSLASPAALPALLDGHR